jgi:hypothetical protein
MPTEANRKADRETHRFISETIAAEMAARKLSGATMARAVGMNPVSFHKALRPDVAGNYHRRWKPHELLLVARKLNWEIGHLFPKPDTQPDLGQRDRT